MLLFFLKFKFNLIFLLFIKIIFNFNCENKKNIKVFLKKKNIKIKFMFL